jgi:signal recognition particle subunit SRP54
LNSLLGVLPGGLGTRIGEVDVDEKAIKRIEAMLTSMTPEERRKPQILNASRKRRIVKGSGSSIQELNRLLKQYEQMKTMMKQFTGKGSKRKMANMMSQFSRGKMPFGM